MKILHLTHTDIRTDSRILKELSALNDTGIYNLYGVGVSEQHKKGGVSHIHLAKVFALRLLTRSLRWLPSPIRHSLVYIEMSLKVLVTILIIRPKLIHCHDTPLLPIASIGAFLVRSKVIYDAHELESKKNGQSSSISKLTYLLEAIKKPQSEIQFHDQAPTSQDTQILFCLLGCYISHENRIFLHYLNLNKIFHKIVVSYKLVQIL